MESVDPEHLLEAKRRTTSTVSAMDRLDQSHQAGPWDDRTPRSQKTLSTRHLPFRRPRQSRTRSLLRNLIAPQTVKVISRRVTYRMSGVVYAELP